MGEFVVASTTTKPIALSSWLMQCLSFKASNSSAEGSRSLSGRSRNSTPPVTAIPLLFNLASSSAGGSSKKA